MSVAIADAFRNISVQPNNTLVAAELVGDTLTLTAGIGISIVADPATDKITIVNTGNGTGAYTEITNTNANNTYYPLFSRPFSPSDINPEDAPPSYQLDTIYVDNTTTPMTYNPSTGILTLTGVQFPDGSVQLTKITPPTVEVGLLPPPLTTSGSLWLDSNSGSLYVYIDINGTGQWIQPSNDGSGSGGGGYTLPVASTFQLGGVKVDGTTVVIDGNGVISFAGGTLPIATTSILGGVKVDGTTVTIDGSGVISATGVSTNTPNTVVRRDVGGNFAAGNVSVTKLLSGHVQPNYADTYDLGTEQLTYRNLYLSGSLFIGGKEINLDGNTLDLPPGTTIGGFEPALENLSITGITYPFGGAAVSTLGGEFVLVSGAGFKQYCTILINGAPAAGTSFISSTQVRFTTTPQVGGLATLQIQNTDGSSATYNYGLLYVANGFPRFTQSSGQLGVFVKDDIVSIALGVTGGVGPYTFNIASGTLPAGVQLSTQTGVISGIAPDEQYETVYNFALTVSDSSIPVRSTTSNFYIVVDPLSTANLAKLMFSIGSNYQNAAFARGSNELTFSIGSNYTTYVKAQGSKELSFSIGSNYLTYIRAQNSVTLDFSFSNNGATYIEAQNSKTLDFSINSNYLVYLKAQGSKELTFSVAGDNP